MEFEIRAWDGTHMFFPTNIEIGTNAWNMKPSISFPLPEGGVCTTAYIMFYTGAKDKNGRKIFTGDIICYENRLWEVLYEPTWYGFTAVCNEGRVMFYQVANVFDEDDSCPYIEVVGNRYENKDLYQTIREGAVIFHGPEDLDGED